MSKHSKDEDSDNSSSNTDDEENSESSPSKSSKSTKSRTDTARSTTKKGSDDDGSSNSDTDDDDATTTTRNDATKTNDGNTTRNEDDDNTSSSSSGNSSSDESDKESTKQDDSDKKKVLPAPPPLQGVASLASLPSIELVGKQNTDVVQIDFDEPDVPPPPPPKPPAPAVESERASGGKKDDSDSSSDNDESKSNSDSDSSSSSTDTKSTKSTKSKTTVTENLSITSPVRRSNTEIPANTSITSVTEKSNDKTSKSRDSSSDSTSKSGSDSDTDDGDDATATNVDGTPNQKPDRAVETPQNQVKSNNSTTNNEEDASSSKKSTTRGDDTSTKKSSKKDTDTETDTQSQNKKSSRSKSSKKDTDTETDTQSQNKKEKSTPTHAIAVEEVISKGDTAPAPTPAVDNVQNGTLPPSIPATTKANTATDVLPITITQSDPVSKDMTEGTLLQAQSQHGTTLQPAPLKPGDEMNVSVSIEDHHTKHEADTVVIQDDSASPINYTPPAKAKPLPPPPPPSLPGGSDGTQQPVRVVPDDVRPLQTITPQKKPSQGSINVNQPVEGATPPNTTRRLSHTAGPDEVKVVQKPRSNSTSSSGSRSSSSRSNSSSESGSKTSSSGSKDTSSTSRKTSSKGSSRKKVKAKPIDKQQKGESTAVAVAQPKESSATTPDPSSTTKTKSQSQKKVDPKNVLRTVSPLSSSPGESRIELTKEPLLPSSLYHPALLPYDKFNTLFDRVVRCVTPTVDITMVCKYLFPWVAFPTPITPEVFLSEMSRNESSCARLLQSHFALYDHTTCGMLPTWQMLQVFSKFDVWGFRAEVGLSLDQGKTWTQGLSWKIRCGGVDNTDLVVDLSGDTVISISSVQSIIKLAGNAEFLPIESDGKQYLIQCENVPALVRVLECARFVLETIQFASRTDWRGERCVEYILFCICITKDPSGGATNILRHVLYEKLSWEAMEPTTAALTKKAEGRDLSHTIGGAALAKKTAAAPPSTEANNTPCWSIELSVAKVDSIPNTVTKMKVFVNAEGGRLISTHYVVPFTPATNFSKLPCIFDIALPNAAQFLKDTKAVMVVQFLVTLLGHDVPVSVCALSLSDVFSNTSWTHVTLNVDPTAAGNKPGKIQFDLKRSTAFDAVVFPPWEQMSAVVCSPEAVLGLTWLWEAQPEAFSPQDMYRVAQCLQFPETTKALFTMYTERASASGCGKVRAVQKASTKNVDRVMGVVLSSALDVQILEVGKPNMSRPQQSKPFRAHLIK